MNVSRETVERLTMFEAAVLKWNKAINLVSAAHSNDVMDRHIRDSLQIADHVEFQQNWLDMGSGGGFPGLVMAIVAKDVSPGTQFSLVESDKRKCAFLLSVIGDLGLNAKVHSQRVESYQSNAFDTISARALAPLSKLIELSKPFCHDATTCIFPKGRTHLAELAEAQKKWTFDYDLVQSTTDSSAALFKIRNIA